MPWELCEVRCPFLGTLLESQGLTAGFWVPRMAEEQTAHTKFKALCRTIHCFFVSWKTLYAVFKPYCFGWDCTMFPWRLYPSLLSWAFFLVWENTLEQPASHRLLRQGWCHFICCLLRWLLFKFALGKPFKKKLNTDDYNVYTTLKLLICSSNNLGF